MAAKRASKASQRVKDLAVKKSRGVRGGVLTRTQLSGPYNDRVRDEFTAVGDPGR